MKFLTLSKTGFTAVACAVLGGFSIPAHAESLQDSIFAKVEPSVRDRMFFRLSYIHVNTKSTSGDTYDVSGPVLRAADIDTVIANSSTSMFHRLTSSSPPAYGILLSGLKGGMEADADAGCERLYEGLGTPCGIKGRSQAVMGTPALSVGYFLDTEYKWALEAFVLAAPLKASVYVEGPVSLNGQKVLQTKLLPPTALLGYYFGKKEAKIRPYVGFGASYAMFFDARSTDSLDQYVGGKTSISIQNAMGFGPFLGLKTQMNDDWHVNLSVGQIRFKTEATLTTRDTVITGKSAVINDYGPNVRDAITITLDPTRDLLSNSTNGPSIYAPNTRVDVTTALMCDLARLRYGNTSCNQGTFVRKQKMDLDNTLIMLSVGRNF